MTYTCTTSSHHWKPKMNHLKKNEICKFNANLRRFHSMKCFDWELYLRHFHSMKCFDWEPYLKRFHSMKCFRLRAIFETFSFYEVLLIESHICSDANKFKPQNPGDYGTSLSQLKVSPCIIPWSAISVCIYLSLSILHLQILCDLLAPDQNQTQYQPPNCWRYFIWVVHKCLCFFTLITQTTSLESHAVISIFLTACYGLKKIPLCGPALTLILVDTCCHLWLRRVSSGSTILW